MSDKGKTKDEKYILAMYEFALQSGDLHSMMNKYEIGKRVGLSERAVDTILNLLAQANFVKKESSLEISLTSQGERLAKTLLNSL